MIVDATQTFLDIAFLQAELETFVRDAEPSASIEDSQLLSRAEVLVSKVQAAWLVLRDRAEPVGNPGDGIWHAAVTLDETGRQDVLLFRGRTDEVADAVLEGTWAASADSPSRLCLLTVQIGDRVWGMRETDHGRSLFDTDGGLTGPGDAKLFAEIAQSARQTPPRLTQPQSLVVGWVCARCDWPNSANAALCQLCGTLKNAAPAPTAQASSLFGGAEFEGLPPELSGIPSGAHSSIPELLETLLDPVLGTIRAGNGRKKFCTSCGAERKRPGQKFCGTCGARIRGVG